MFYVIDRVVVYDGMLVILSKFKFKKSDKWIHLLVFIQGTAYSLWTCAVRGTLPVYNLI